MAVSPVRSEVATEPQSETTKVMLVDDSIVVRSIIERIIESDPKMQVVGSVATAPEAIAMLDHQAVDAIVLDLEMPVMHGLAAIPLLVAKRPEARIIILSANCEDGGPAAVEALSLGAADTLLKPGKGTFAGQFGATLLERVRALSAHRSAPDDNRRAAVPARPEARPLIASRAIAAIGIGASTGGIMAINQFLAALPDNVCAPLFITQHLPPGFIGYFAEQLQRACSRDVFVAADGMMVRPGHVYLAPGDSHLRVMPLDSGCRIILDRSVAPSGASPSVDPMLASLADCYGTQLCGVMLSGMGRDGLHGARRLCQMGGLMLAQDITSSVVWGMPGAVAKDGLVQAQGSPAELAQLVARIASGAPS